MVMNRMTDEVRQEYLWTKMFADDFVSHLQGANGRQSAKVKAGSQKKTNERQSKQNRMCVKTRVREL